MIRQISLSTPHGPLLGHLEMPETPGGLVFIARIHQPEAEHPLAASLLRRGYAVLGMELLSTQERHYADAIHNVPKLTQRVIAILDLIRDDGDMAPWPLAIGTFGDITPAVLRAAARRDAQVRALACHGGLVDQAGLESLRLLAAPLLMLFDADDGIGQIAWQRAQRHLGCASAMQVLAPGDDPAPATADWFARHLPRPDDRR